MMNPQQDDSWRTPMFRQNVVQRIDHALQLSGTALGKSGSEMEQRVFMKANQKEEYLNMVAKLIMHVRQMKAANQGMNTPQPVGPGAGPPNMNSATNLLQTLNHSRPQLQNRMPGMQQTMMNVMGNMPSMQGQLHTGLMGQINVPIGNQNNMNVPSVANANMPAPGSMMNTNTMSGATMVNSGSMPNQIGMPNQMPNTLSGSVLGQMSGMINNQVIGGQGTPSVSGMPQVQMNVHAAGPRRMMPDGMMMPVQDGVPYVQPRMSMSNQFIRQNTPPPSQSPMQMNPGSVMIPSPALVPSPSPQMPSTGGLAAPVMRQMGPNLAVPSPNPCLNTPGNPPQMTPSPIGNDDQAYRDKVKELSKYIGPLQRMIQRSGSGDREKKGKMKKLLEILSSPGQRITMDILLKCEAVLEKMELKGEEQHPLIEAISNALKSPNPNHTFQRTFETVMATLNGKPLKTLPKPLKQKYVEEPICDIPEVLQGEVARLDQRFKVSLDPVQQDTSKCVYLLCWLDDRHLPCIPPVQIMIPEDYPNNSPKCSMSNYEYGATKFLKMIQEALQSRISKLPARYTMSQLLDTWESSVRETCSTDRIASLDSVFLVS